MKIYLKVNFFRIFAYDSIKTDKKACARNCLKGVAYAPVIGAAIQAVILGIICCTPNKQPNDWALVGFFAGRVILAIPGPLILPIIDIIATLWQAKHGKHNSSEIGE